MNSALSHRLQNARQRLFVGRQPEIEAWRNALDAPQWPIPIWYVHGLGGIGKTSLLRQWKKLAEGQGVPVAALDARDFDPSMEAFCAALREVLNETASLKIENSASPAEWSEAIALLPTRVVIQIDTYELLEPLDDWIRDSFLPHLPDNCAVTLAGRLPLPLPWRGDGGWQELVRTFDLGELSAVESSDYLERRGIKPEAQPDMLAWAHGHPLALSLSADVWLQRPQSTPLVFENGETLPEQKAGPFRPGDVPQLVGSLLGHLVREVPTKAHRIALEACAIVAVMTEELLVDMIPAEVLGASHLDIHAVFEWLRTLSIIQTNRLGLFPHDLAREVLVADSRWRSPQFHGDLHRRAREHYLRHIHQSSGSEQQRAIFDCIFLHRTSPAVAPYLQWHDNRCTIDTARPGEIEELLSWVEKFEGPESQRIAARWFEVQPENLVLIRAQNGSPQGLIFLLALQDAASADIQADPAAQAAMDYLNQHAPLRAGEKATHFRYWMDKETYQDVGATQSLVFVHAARHYIVTPHLAFTIFPCSTPDFWNLGFAYADIERLPAIDYTTDGHQFGCFVHDWRTRPVLSWFDVLAQRESQTVAVEPPSSAPSTSENKYRFLDEVAFHAAVRQSLRQWGEPILLRRNPLLETALIGRRARQISGTSAVPSAEDKERALRSLLREAVSALAIAPRQDRAFRALELVYGRRTLSQESAADAMNVSRSSFRRYLRAAVQFIGESLWFRESSRVESEPALPFESAQNERNMNLF